MQHYQQTALDYARANSLPKLPESMEYLNGVCKRHGVRPVELIARMLQRPVTLNFHPDRISSDGRTVLESMTGQGYYHCQFLTGTTNGSRTAFPGGERYEWEQRLFGGAYPESARDRPKYDALNVLSYADGASMRFGSCFIALNTAVTRRCTFCYGDSSDAPKALCTADTFGCVVAELMHDVANHKRLLNQCVSTEQEALAILMRRRIEPARLRRNLDFCIEAHIHGDVSLASDVTALYLDRSYVATSIHAQAEELCMRYSIPLRWIPERSVRADAIDELFRGPGIVKLARKLEANCRGTVRINAMLLGEASQDSVRNAQRWSDLGSAAEVFQYFKQLWHYVGYFG